MTTTATTTAVCGGCSGSGSCDVCDGYGTTPDTSPGAGDGRDCPGDGICPVCHGTGTPCTATTPEETTCP
ncbi:hypothetical protein GCM10009609_62720 [Pseudonocardia aurantiaca]|uniref:Molecular chaperone DnaJ n=1 Tax=Pseudonocardia aurantiaca TaxID=75290 RepID=A0ABW4FS44_9PSEU